MAGTSAGNKKVAAGLLAKDPDHFKKLGRKGLKGGKYSSGSFATGSVHAARAGERGGSLSKRKPVIEDKLMTNQLEQVITTAKIMEGDK